MPAPQFTDAERAVLHHLKKSSWLDNLAFDAGYLSAAGMFFLVGILSESLGPVLLGMGSILAIKTWELSHQRRFLPLLKSAIEKYERLGSTEGFEPDATADSDQAMRDVEDLQKPHLTIRAMLVIMFVLGVFCAGWVANEARHRTLSPDPPAFLYE